MGIYRFIKGRHELDHPLLLILLFNPGWITKFKVSDSLTSTCFSAFWNTYCIYSTYVSLISPTSYTSLPFSKILPAFWSLGTSTENMVCVCVYVYAGAHLSSWRVLKMIEKTRGLQRLLQLVLFLPSCNLTFSLGPLVWPSHIIA